MSLNESDPKYIVHHLKQQRKYERRLARERQAEEERNSIKAAMRSVEQRLQFERQRLEQAHKYSASGLQPRPAYEDAELTAQHLRANGIDGSTIRGSLDLSSTARGRSAESFHEFLGGAEARSPRVSLPGTRHLRVVDRLLMEEEEEVKRAGQRAVSGRTRAQDLRAEQATLREVSDLDQFEYKLKTASTQRKHNMQYD